MPSSCLWLLSLLFILNASTVMIYGSPLDDLAHVFGVKKVPKNMKNQTPLYLKRLYESIADGHGNIVRAGPYHSNTMVGYLDKASSEQTYFSYNITRSSAFEQFRYADLHLFRLRPKIKSNHRTKRSIVDGLIKLKLYQITHPGRKNTPFGNILLSQKMIPSYQFGWVVFEVSQAAQNWMESSGTSNYGLKVFAFDLNGRQVDQQLRFMQRNQYRDSLQPALVVYTADGAISSTQENNQFDRDFNTYNPQRYDNVYTRKYKIKDDSRSQKQHRVVRRRRSVTSGPDNNRCRRYPMYVDFRKVGWDDWIISPIGYNAYVCRGTCPFPMAQQVSPTNHAVVQSIVSHLYVKLGQTIPAPCCVPSQLSGISMLYYDDQERVVLKQYDSMIATACGCK